MRSLVGLFLWAPAVSVGAGILLAVAPVVSGSEAKSAHVPTLSHTNVQINQLSRVLALRGDDAIWTVDSIPTATKRDLKEDNDRDEDVEEGVADCGKDCQKAMKKAKKDEEKALKKAEKEAAKAAKEVTQEAIEQTESDSVMKENVFIEDVNDEPSKEIATVGDIMNHSPAIQELEPEPEVETTPLDTTTNESDEVFLQQVPNSSQGGIRGMTPGGKFGISLVFIALFALVVFAAFQVQAYASRKDFRVWIPWKKTNERSDDGIKNDSTLRANGTTDINTSTDTNSGLHKELDDLVEYLRVVEASTQDTDICAFEEGEGFEVWS